MTYSLSQELICNLPLWYSEFRNRKRLLLPHFLIFLPGAFFPSGYADGYCYKLEPAGSSVCLEAEQTLVIKLASGDGAASFLCFWIFSYAAHTPHLCSFLSSSLGRR